MKEKNIITTNEPSVQAEGKNRRLRNEELEKVNGGRGGYGQDEETGNEPYIGDGSKPSNSPSPKKP